MTRKAKIITEAAVVAIIVVLAVVIVVITGGTSAPTTAAGVVTANGYTVEYQASGAQLPSSLYPYATSAAVGQNGDNGEAVIVFKPGNTGLESEVSSVLQSEDPQLNYAVSGDELVITGTLADFSGLSSF